MTSTTLIHNISAQSSEDIGRYNILAVGISSGEELILFWMHVIFCWGNCFVVWRTAIKANLRQNFSQTRVRNSRGRLKIVMMMMMTNGM